MIVLYSRIHENFVSLDNLLFFRFGDTMEVRIGLIFFCIACSVVPMLDAASSSRTRTTLHAFVCKERLYIVEEVAYMHQLVEYLDDTFDRLDFSDHGLAREHRWCHNESMHKGADVSSFGPRTVAWLESQLEIYEDKTKFLYMPSHNTYKLYEIQNYRRFDQDSLELKGCLFTIQTPGVEEISFNFTARGYNRDNNFCQERYDAFRENKYVFSPLHGRPVIINLKALQKVEECIFEDKKMKMWFALDAFAVGRTDLLKCFELLIDEFGLAHSSKDMHIATSFWGHPAGMRELETVRFGYFEKKMISWGYEPGVSLRGAPYDWRKTPDENEDFMRKFRLLIEETYEINHFRKVVLFAHSMGNMFSLYFLNRQSKEWKDKYIKSIVCMAGPFGGSVSVLKLLMRVVSYLCIAYTGT
uniref:Uncharacterized protein n=1 Tax=Romanomermis culicivorax TaxID=13658 RepID=A0A915JUF8_ROMCU